MKQGKILLVIAGATVLLAALVGTASAGRLSTTELRLRATWTRLSYATGGGTAECEVAVEGAFHERTIAKTRGRLSGLITAAAITRCARGGVTVLRETLPWHVQYDSFTGTLPNISAIRANIIGLSFRLREPVFGIECLARSTTESPGTLTFNRETATGTTISATAGGTLPCGSFSGGLSGTTSTLVDSGGARVTVTLI
jgi:hypothetical protein